MVRPNSKQPHRDSRESRIARLLFFVLLFPAGATTEECELYHYYDPGTKLCEFCCDLCCDAIVKGTSRQCEEDCPKYAQMQMEEAAQQRLQRLHDGQSLGNGERTGDSSGSGESGFPLAAQIGIPLASCAVLALLILLILLILWLVSTSKRRREALVRKNASKGVLQPVASPHEAVRLTETMIPLPAQPSFPHDIALRIGYEETREPLVIQASGEGSGESLALRIVNEDTRELLAIQASGEGSEESLEERSREGYGGRLGWAVGEAFGVTIAPAAEAFGELSGETGFFEGAPDLSVLSTVPQTASCTPQPSDGRPHQESMEGRRGKKEFVPNEGNPLKSDDDTQRKTFASSDPLGMGSTRV